MSVLRCPVATSTTATCGLFVWPAAAIVNSTAWPPRNADGDPWWPPPCTAAARARCVGGKHDGVSIAPARAERPPGHGAEHDGRPTPDRHLLEFCVLKEPDPLTVWRKEWRVGVGDIRERLCVELIDRPHHQRSAGAVGPSEAVHKVPAIG